MPRIISALLLLMLVTSCALPGVMEPAMQLHHVQLSQSPAEQWRRLELTIDMQAGYTNPFDPGQIDLIASFTMPNGTTLQVPGFFYQDYRSRLVDGREVLTPEGPPVWKVRLTPQLAGAWSYQIRAKTPQAETSLNGQFQVSATADPGFIRRDPRHPHYVAFDNGQPFLAIGQNVAWYGDGGSYDYQRWFERMQRAGANFARLWMPSWAMGIEWKDTGLGDYRQRMDRAWQLDRIFELAEQHQIYLMVALLNHGAFNTSVNPEWDANPYNQANGGPCAEPACFASNPQARELFQRRLRYIVARWGYSTHLMAWEWWNEVDWTPMASSSVQRAWIEEMNGVLDQFDPYKHLRTTSYARSGDDEIWELPSIDIIQRHVYETTDPINSFPRGTQEMRQFGKPVIYGEFGYSAGETDTTSPDQTGIHIHSGLWAGLMSGGFGTGMSWWWDSYIEPLNLERLFAGPAGFFADEDPAGAQLEPVTLALSAQGVTGLGLVGPDHALGWIKNDQYGYKAAQEQYTAALRQALKQKQPLTQFAPQFDTITNVSVTLRGLKPGAYRVEWWDSHNGTILNSSATMVEGNLVQIAVPAFDSSIAFKVIRSTP